MASTGETWRLGRRPALDGVRGIAIVLVLARHTMVDWLPYGRAGVDLFFVLSGFLITSILLEQREATGRCNFVEFYRRRALRLLPALVVFVAACSLVALALTGYTPRQVTVAAGSALFYVANYSVAAGNDLWVMGQTWSLAVEEQFYLLWPLALAVLAPLGRRALVALCGAGVLVSVLVRGGQDPHSPLLGSGSIERGAPILIGCALALLIAGHPALRLPRWLPVAGLAVLLAAPWVPYPGAEALVHLVDGLAAAALVLAAAQRGAGWLEWGPLRLLGQRSYGLYLWHYPIMALALANLDGWAWLAAVPVTLAASWLLTVLSWRYIEQPFLRRKDPQAVENPEPSSDTQLGPVVVPG